MGYLGKQKSMMTDSEFKGTLTQYLNSARPIQNFEHLKGRQKAHQNLVDALNVPGKHAFIYGSRGVGKTSLAQTSAKTVQPTLQHQLLIACDHSSTFESICRDIIKRLLALDPCKVAVHRKWSGGVNILGSGINVAWDANKEKIDC
jgi:Cdc6-like AAA superfamily ATPase